MMNNPKNRILALPTAPPPADVDIPDIPQISLSVPHGVAQYQLTDTVSGSSLWTVSAKQPKELLVVLWSAPDPGVFCVIADEAILDEIGAGVEMKDATIQWPLYRGDGEEDDGEGGKRPFIDKIIKLKDLTELTPDKTKDVKTDNKFESKDYTGVEFTAIWPTVPSEISGQPPMMKVVEGR